MNDWYFQPVFQSYAAAFALAGALAALLAVRPSGAQVPRLRRGALIGLRAAVVLLVLLGLLRPTYETFTTLRKPATLLLLADTSRSMQLPSGQGDATRWDRQQQTLAGLEPVLRELAGELNVQLYSYDRRLEAVAWNNGRPAWPMAAEGEATDLTNPLVEALRQVGGDRIAALVLLGDGTQTAPIGAGDLFAAPRELRRRGEPLLAVGIGPPGDARQSRDVAVETLQDEYTVFVNNELTIDSLIRIEGMANKEIPVDFVVTDDQGREVFRRQERVRAAVDQQQTPVSFRFSPDQVGLYQITVSVEPQPGELLAANNQLSAYLHVLEGGVRVLLVEGNLAWHRNFLRRALAESRDLEIDFLKVNPRGRDLPLAERLASKPYDVILLGDVDSAVLGSAGCEAIAEAVDAGAGFAMLGGEHSFGPGGYGSTKLAEVLPITFDPLERQDFDAPIALKWHHRGEIRPRPSLRHFITAIGPGDDFRTPWTALPPLTEGANRFAGIKTRGVETLLTNEPGEPLLVSGEYGRGRTLACALRSTWRWQMFGFESEYRRFWRQMILWLARRDGEESSDLYLRPERRRLPAGNELRFTVGARRAGRELPTVEPRVTLVGPDGLRLPVLLTRAEEGWQGAVVETEQPGAYRLEAEADVEGERLTAEREVMLYAFDREWSSPAADLALLAQMAEMTSEHGGRVVAPEQLADVLREIGRTAPAVEYQRRLRWQPGDTFADALLWLLLLTALLAAEWVLRKRWNLV